MQQPSLIPLHPTFCGSDFVVEHDQVRLENQQARILKAMEGGAWKTLRELAAETGDGEASISAQLRHLKRPQFGAYCVEKRRRGAESRGTFEYRIKESR